MLADLIDALDRRYRLWETRSNEDVGQVLPELAAFLDFVRREPRLRALSDDLTREAEDAVRRFRLADEQLVAEVVRLRGDIAAAHPATDDTGLPRPGPTDEPVLWEGSYAHFDRLVNELDAGMVPSRFPAPTTGRIGKASRLVEILSGKRADISQAGGWSDALGERMRRVEDGIEHLTRHWVTFDRTSAARSLCRIEAAVEFQRAPPPSLGGPAMADDPFHPLASLRDRSLGLLADGALASDEEFQARVVQNLRVEGERVYEELRARLGSARSYRGLFERFRLRAQLYDAAELRRIARHAGRQSENALTERLARFLFDQGLNPLTRPLVGRLEPDLLDTSSAWSLYVEAKRYNQQRNARRYLRDGIEQVCDTLSNLQGYPQALREVFYVVFRLGGPRYELPEEIRRDGVVIHPILIDIAPPVARGSRRKTQTIRIPPEEWMPVGGDAA